MKKISAVLGLFLISSTVYAGGIPSDSHGDVKILPKIPVNCSAAPERKAAMIDLARVRPANNSDKLDNPYNVRDYVALEIYWRHGDCYELSNKLGENSWGFNGVILTPEFNDAQIQQAALIVNFVNTHITSKEYNEHQVLSTILIPKSGLVEGSNDFGGKLIGPLDFVEYSFTMKIIQAGGKLNVVGFEHDNYESQANEQREGTTSVPYAIISNPLNGTVRACVSDWKNVKRKVDHCKPKVERDGNGQIINIIDDYICYDGQWFPKVDFNQLCKSELY